jgi:type II secretory pathway predicted ATPase ExeA
MVWMRHWGLARDPFSAVGTPYVSLPSHDEAVARLVFAVETGERRTVLSASAGMGKTAVLRKALSDVHNPRRRIASVSCPHDGTLLFTLLAERLSQRVAREPTRLGAWRALERAIRLAALHGDHVTFIIDDCSDQLEPTMRRDLDSLHQLGSTSSAGVTVIQLQRTGAEAGPSRYDKWPPAIAVERLTRSQAELYLATKFEWAGSTERIFTSRAITRLHSLSLGVPRGLEELALRCLIAGAGRRLEVINPELVDGTLHESQAASLVTSP